MNATPPVLPAFIPDAGAAAAGTATQSAPSRSDGSPTFAGTLKDVGAKAGRKAVAAKAQGGESVPPAGNVTPPAPPTAPAPTANQHAVPPADPAVPAASGKGSNPSASQTTDAPAVGTAPAAGTTVAIQPPVAIVPTPTPTPAPTSAPSAVVARAAPSLPGVAGAAVATPPDDALLPRSPIGDASGAAAAPASTAAPSTPGAAVSGPSTAAAGTGKSAAAATRPTFKAAFPHLGSAPNVAADSADDHDATSATSSAASIAPPVAVATDATSPSTASDVSAAAALAALASSRSAYSAAADSSDESGAAVTGAAAVAGASSLTDASMTGSAAATAAAAQATLLQGVARAEKHAVGSVDAAGTGTSGIGVASAAVAAGGLDAAAGLSQTGSGATTAPDAVPTPTVRVAANVDSAEFPQELSSRVSWMVDNNLNGAKLQVNPPALGPIELRILVSGDHAQVWMSSHSAVTRDALENSTPKLREMLGTQGFSQVSVDISQRSFQERSAYSQPYEHTSTPGRGGSAAVASVAGTVASRNSQGILDAYA